MTPSRDSFRGSFTNDRLVVFLRTGRVLLPRGRLYLDFTRNYRTSSYSPERHFHLALVYLVAVQRDSSDRNGFLSQDMLEPQIDEVIEYMNKVRARTETVSREVARPQSMSAKWLSQTWSRRMAVIRNTKGELRLADRAPFEIVERTTHAPLPLRGAWSTYKKRVFQLAYEELFRAHSVHYDGPMPRDTDESFFESQGFHIWACNRIFKAELAFLAKLFSANIDAGRARFKIDAQGAQVAACPPLPTLRERVYRWRPRSTEPRPSSGLTEFLHDQLTGYPYEIVPSDVPDGRGAIVKVRLAEMSLLILAEEDSGHEPLSVKHVLDFADRVSGCANKGVYISSVGFDKEAIVAAEHCRLTLYLARKRGGLRSLLSHRPSSVVPSFILYDLLAGSREVTLGALLEME